MIVAQILAHKIIRNLFSFSFLLIVACGPGMTEGKIKIDDSFYFFDSGGHFLLVSIKPNAQEEIILGPRIISIINDGDFVFMLQNINADNFLSKDNCLIWFLDKKNKKLKGGDTIDKFFSKENIFNLNIDDLKKSTMNLNFNGYCFKK